MKKEEKNVAQLTDDEILEGFRNADEHIVKEYFYGYCRVAYCIYDRCYDLQYKPGRTSSRSPMNITLRLSSTTSANWRTASLRCR